MSELVECVPNVSEGRDRAIIDALAAAISSVHGVELLDVDPGADTNRTVYTFVGPPAAVGEAALALARRTGELVDMRRHQGAHPRIGALDVCPFVPVSGVTMEQCVALARDVGRRIAEELDVPVYFYERAATSEERRSLANIRAGEYEGLPQKLADPAWAPDAGPARFNPRAGATVVGAREFLIAYNVNLNTRDRRLANEIALTIREAGRVARSGDGQPLVDETGVPVRNPGRLRAVRAIGWYIDAYRQAQVSINLTDYRTTPLHVVFETVCEEAARLGLRVTGSELVGLIPREPLVEAGRYYLRRQGKSPGAPERELIEMAVRSLGLDQLGPFDPAKKIVEYRVRPAAPLAAMTLERFSEEVSSDTPVPGGGSVAALAGSLAAALAAMVGSLTVGKKGFEAASERNGVLAVRAQEIRAALVDSIDDDARAFEGVLEAMRRPKGTPDEERARSEAMVRATERAARVPLETARRSLEALRLCVEAAEYGTPAASSDAGAGAAMARAAIEAARLNVLINLLQLPEGPFRADARREIDALRDEGQRLAEACLARVARGFATT